MRGRPCLIAIAPTLHRKVAFDLAAAAGQAEGDAIDVVLYSHGGAIDAAYVVARDLRRRFEEVAVFVPLCAKSAATLVALAADELVLGPWGELGPLDAQVDRSGSAEPSNPCSEVAHVRALRDLDGASVAFFQYAARQVLSEGGFMPADAGGLAAQILEVLRAPIYGQIDPVRYGQAVLALEVAEEYLKRLLGRYHPEIGAERAIGIVRRLVYDYPCHGFVIDLEELWQMGLSARPTEAPEAEAIEGVMAAVLPHDDRLELIDLVPPPPGAGRGGGESDPGADDERAGEPGVVETLLLRGPAEDAAA